MELWRLIVISDSSEDNDPHDLNSEDLHHMCILFFQMTVFFLYPPYQFAVFLEQHSA